jgi:hypothetical protein
VSDCGICLYICGLLGELERMWREVGDGKTVVAFAKEMRKTV